MSDVILNVAVGGSYPLGQRRLIKSLNAVGSRTPRMFWQQWPGLSHAIHPAGFKVDAFDAARAAGYQRALWLDSQVIAVAPLDSVWSHLDDEPVLLLEDATWNLGEWTDDRALEVFGISRDAALKMPICWTKVVGIDFQDANGTKFLRRWRELRDAGAFDGPWHKYDRKLGRDAVINSTDPRCRGHRHDQSCASWLAHDLDFAMVPRSCFISEYPDETGPVFVAKGNQL